MARCRSSQHHTEQSARGDRPYFIAFVLAIAAIGLGCLLTNHGPYTPMGIGFDLVIGGFVLAAIHLLVRKFVNQSQQTTQATTALRQAESRFRSAMEDGFDSFYVLKAIHDEHGNVDDFIIEDLNQNGAQSFGREREDIIGKRRSAVLQMQSTDAMFEEYIRAMATGKAIQREYFVDSSNLEAEWLQHQVVPVDDGVVVMTRDISNTKRAEQQLRTSEERYRGIVEDQTELICRATIEGELLFINSAYARYFGVDPERVIGTNFKPHVVEDDLPFIESKFAEITAENPVSVMEHRVILRSGEITWMHWTVRAILNQYGDVSEIQGVGVDITEEHRARELLQESESRYQLAVRGSSDGLWDWDIQNNTVYYSPRFKELLGFKDEELGDTLECWTSRLHAFDKKSTLEAIQQHIEQGNPYDVDYRLKTTANAFRWFRARGEAVRDEQGHAIRMVGSISDITESKVAEANLERFAEDLWETKEALESQAIELARKSEELEFARVSAEAASQSKSDFLANMSHEIRTPMTAILGYSELLLDAEQSEEDQCDCVQIIHRNGEHLLAIINDILDLSKIESGRMTVERIQCDPWAIAQDVCDLVRPRAEGKGLTLQLENEDALPITISSDPIRLRQILLNLVGNAIKFTESGGVWIKIELVIVESGSPRIAFEVMDTGVGLSEEQIEHLFQPFTQADDSTTRKFGGTGLGLSISRRLAEMLGGRITVTSKPHAGSTFRVEIATGDLSKTRMTRTPTVAPSNNQPANRVADTQMSAARILLVEDGPDNQRLFSFHLRKAGATVAIAENGRIAVDAIHDACAQGEPFELILMDMQMPEMDGYEATRLLRTEGCTTPIIGITAHAMAGDREKVIAAGCDEYIAKPVNRNALLAACQKWLSKQRSSRAA